MLELDEYLKALLASRAVALSPLTCTFLDAVDCHSFRAQMLPALEQQYRMEQLQQGGELPPISDEVHLRRRRRRWSRGLQKSRGWRRRCAGWRMTTAIDVLSVGRASASLQCRRESFCDAEVPDDDAHVPNIKKSATRAQHLTPRLPPPTTS